MIPCETRLKASQKSFVGKNAVGGSGLICAPDDLLSATAVCQWQSVIKRKILPELAIFLWNGLLANVETLSTGLSFCHERPRFRNSGRNCRALAAAETSTRGHRTSTCNSTDPQSASRFGRIFRQLGTLPSQWTPPSLRFFLEATPATEDSKASS